MAQNHAAKIDKHTVVIDCCGTKRKVCAACFPIAEQYGITYLGGHPMAGTQFSGFKYAKANLFVGARWCSCRRALTTLNYSAM